MMASDPPTTVHSRQPPDTPHVLSPPPPAGDAAHIAVTDLVVRYGSVTAVGGVSFTVRPGEQLTLLGPSGCGKTTVLRAIAGLEQPATGEIWIGGVPAYSAAKRVNVRPEQRGISMVFQSYAIWPHMTVFDNIAFPLKIRHASRHEIDQKVKKMMDMVRLTGLGDRPATQVSGGQQQSLHACSRKRGG
jgi:iron(III) transport system ATP-binding protein